MADSWLVDACQQLITRNTFESRPFRSIHTAYEDVWDKADYLENRRAHCRRVLETVEYEVAELSRQGAEDPVKRAVLVNQHIDELYGGLREHNSWEQNSAENSFAKLNRRIHDQQKRIYNQMEELKMAKTELSELVEKSVLADSERVEMQKQNTDTEMELKRLREENEEQRIQISALKSETVALVERILTDKNKSADEMNRMNTFIDELRNRPSMNSAASLNEEEYSAGFAKSSTKET